MPNERQRSRIQAAEMSYLRGACGVQRMDGESNDLVCHVKVKELNVEWWRESAQHHKVVWPHGKKGSK